MPILGVKTPPKGDKVTRGGGAECMAKEICIHFCPTLKHFLLALQHISRKYIFKNDILITFFIMSFNTIY